MPDLTLRSLYPEDITQLSRIESSLTGSSRRAFLEKRLAVATANLGEVFLDEIGGMPLDPQTMPDSFITCAVLDGRKLAGYGFARILEGEFGARSAIVELDDIGVDPDYQGKGIGKKVIAGIEQRMGKRNISTLRTQVDWLNFSMIGFFASTAVLDTIGVHPAYGSSGIGHALLSQLLINLSTLQVETVRTKVEHENFDLWKFLSRRGFKPSQRLLLTREIH
jgi:ribosomal protein S18 acetylase RimI-like enzyme